VTGTAAPPLRRVAVAFVEDRGRLLIARRRPGATFAGMWELPGGRCRGGEEPAACVVREVREETGLEVRVERPAAVVVHSYPDVTVELHAFFCSVLAGDARPLESQEVVWVGRDELDRYEFPAANRELFARALITSRVEPDR